MFRSMVPGVLLGLSSEAPSGTPGAGAGAEASSATSGGGGAVEDSTAKGGEGGSPEGGTVEGGGGGGGITTTPVKGAPTIPAARRSKDGVASPPQPTPAPPGGRRSGGGGTPAPGEASSSSGGAAAAAAAGVKDGEKDEAPAASSQVSYLGQGSPHTGTPLSAINDPAPPLTPLFHAHLMLLTFHMLIVNLSHSD